MATAHGNWLEELILNSDDVQETGKKLGKGSYGEVVEVKYLGTLYAAKRIHLELEQSGGKPLEAFMRECEIWSRLRHPNIVQLVGLLYKSPINSKLPALVSEKLDCSLRQFVEKQPPIRINLATKVDVLYQVAQGLAYLHGQRPPIVHRDLSPNNILINESSMTAKLCDFGVARVFHSQASRTGTVISGTEHFMPPESFTSPTTEEGLAIKYADRIDVFSFGCIIICVVTYMWPYPLPSVRQGVEGQLVARTEAERRQKHLDLFNPEESECFLDVVLKCLEFVPSKRPQCMALVAVMKGLSDVHPLKNRASNPESPVGAIKAVYPEAGPVDAVKGYIGSDYGISLKAANGKYLSRVYRGFRQAIDAAKDVKDPYTRFEASLVNGKLVLKADNGKYLSRIHRFGSIQYLEAQKNVPDVYCQFRVLSVGKGLIALQGDNGLFVSRILRGNTNSIEVVKAGMDDECKFIPGVGDLIPPTFEILHITWDESATSVIYQPKVVMSDTFNNGGSSAIEQNFTLSWEEGSTQTTTWKNSWGVEFNYTFGTGLPETVVARHEFSVQLSYNGEYGAKSSVEHTSKFERKIVLQAAAQKKTVAKLVVKKADDVTIPFTAKIKCTKGDGTVKIFEEEGTWHGVVYHSALVDVEELPLDNAY